MIHDLFPNDMSWGWLLAQSTLCMALGLLGSFAFRRQAARAHQALLLGLIMSLLVPLMSLGVDRLGLGLLKLGLLGLLRKWVLCDRT